MDDTTRETLKRELEEAVRQKARLDVVIQYLQARMGITGEADPESQEKQQQQAIGAGVDPVAAVTASEFYGMSAPKATRELLGRMGRTRPLKTDVIFKAIKKGGVEISSKEVLYRSLTRDDSFHKVGRSIWGLAAWYPNAVRRSKRDAIIDDEAEGETPAEATTPDPRNGSLPDEKLKEVVPIESSVNR